MQGILWCMLGAVCRLMLLLVVMVTTGTDGTVSVRSVLTSLALLDVLSWCLHHFPVISGRRWWLMRSVLTNVQVSGGIPRTLLVV